MRKKLYKSRDKKVCGVCGGIAEYFEIDPTIIRLVYLLLVLFGGVGILPYIIAAIIMDDNPEDAPSMTIETSEPVGFKVEDSVKDQDNINGFNS